ncbi:DUF1045 domain-containing protein [Lentibacter sp.]|uniref:DUF1045 domain-containing protein n=1 Tax=Lentibacter sp. TaxID=2024994 RepID=UPI003F6CA223
MYQRFAVYCCPEGALGDFGNAWLTSGAELVARPARYGFHATLKAPFVLADGQTEGGLAGAVKALAAGLGPVEVPLVLSRIGSFFALVPEGDASKLRMLAGACVLELDSFRAPLTEAERARKLRPNMPVQQVENLERWGYPYVLDDFRFHLTLTGPVPKADRAAVEAELRAALPDLSAPHRLESICLCGEDAAGCFHVIQRFALGGA